MKNENPLVFPIRDVNEHPGPFGMTLRDHYAGLAMPLAMECIKDNWAHDSVSFCWDDGDEEGIAEHAYAIADAMLKERIK